MVVQPEKYLDPYETAHELIRICGQVTHYAISQCG